MALKKNSTINEGINQNRKFLIMKPNSVLYTPHIQSGGIFEYFKKVKINQYIC